MRRGVRPSVVCGGEAGGEESKRSSTKLNYKRVLFVVCLILLLLVYCEFLVYYLLVGFGCRYPSLGTNTSESTVLHAMFLADTHLLGYRLGHWFDRLRREWQMKQSFASSYFFFRPEVVVFLGDVFDEAHWCGHEEFHEHVARFRRLFGHNASATRMLTVAGNHDVGFHYATHPYLVGRFSEALNSSSIGVERISINKVQFVLVNSAAMHGDSCFLCSQAVEELSRVRMQLELFKSRPILIQHFPLYRKSDEECGDEADTAPVSKKAERFQPRWDCLSDVSSQLLLDQFRPRFIISGHTHSGCKMKHRLNDGEIVEEWSVASFSWRNRNNPNFLLAKITPDNITLSKCYLPEENTIIAVYCCGGASIILYVGWSRKKFVNKF